MKKLLLVSALLSGTCHADSVYLGGWSKHLVSGDFNETHNLLAYERNSYVAGGFKNSFNDNVYFAGKNFTYDLSVFEFGVIAGAMYGYDEQDAPLLNHNKFQPMLVPHVTIKTDYFIKPTVLMLGEAVAITFRIEF